jgi:hypothetical protein
MGAFIVQQPNGLYCRFSTVVDCPTDWNMTAEDYRELKAENARREADFTIEHYLRPFEWLREYFYPNNMTEEEFEECLKAMSEEPPKKEIIPTTIYIVHEADRFEETHTIFGCYTSIDVAIETLLKTHKDLIFKERFNEWEYPHPNTHRYFYITEEELY